MNIFKCINSTIDKPAYTIEIKNIDFAGGHLGNEKEITKFLETIEEFSYDMETMDRKLVNLACNFTHGNRRVEDVKFYRVPSESKIIMLFASDIRKFRPEEKPFEKGFSIALKRQKFAFAAVEILKPEFKELNEGKFSVPEGWEFDDKLTSRYNRSKGLSF